MIPLLVEIHTTMHKAQKGTAIYKVQMPVKVFTRSEYVEYVMNNQY